jgi:ankyrin repeat protein
MEAATNGLVFKNCHALNHTHPYCLHPGQCVAVGNDENWGPWNHRTTSVIRGADPNTKDNHRWSAIEIADREGNAEIVRLLLKAGSIPLDKKIEIPGTSVTVSP